MFQKLITVLIVPLVFALGAWAQNPSPHQHAAADVIDGSVHPELIPDAVAWRLYLLAVSENPSPLPNESRRQHAHLQKAGLGEQDINATAPILANFKTAYATMIDSYNHSPEVLNNTNDGLPLFLAKRDALVQATRDALKATLTPKGMSNLQAQIQKEKATMRVAAKEAQQ
jgi:hypothetical protein